MEPNLIPQMEPIQQMEPTPLTPLMAPSPQMVPTQPTLPMDLLNGMVHKLHLKIVPAAKLLN